MSPTRIGELLRTARSDQNITVGRIASRTGIPRRELKRWEKGAGRPNPVEIEQLAGALGLGLDGLVPPRFPVAYHAGSGTLTVGDRTAAVVRRAGDPDGNEAVLRTYVDAVARSRGCAPSAGLRLRRDDIVALAELLDLDDVDLEARLVRLLGVSSADAAEVRRHLLGRRAALIAATAAAGVLAAFPVHSASATTPTPAPPSVMSTSATNGVDIGSALVIERGTQPSDPNTQIGDAVHYER